MIEQISIIHYRKLKGISLNFTPGLNFISGANGTCKSSLLHMVSNSFQGVVAKNSGLKDKNCIRMFRIQFGIKNLLKNTLFFPIHYKFPNQ